MLSSSYPQKQQTTHLKDKSLNSTGQRDFTSPDVRALREGSVEKIKLVFLWNEGSQDSSSTKNYSTPLV